jgi:non-ribosomal peptide synthetase component F
VIAGAIDDGTVHRLQDLGGLKFLDEVAGSRPESIALTYRGRSLSYGALASRVNRLANHLRSLGVGREQQVGETRPRSSSAS